MTASTRYERNLPAILDDLSAGPAPEYLDDVFARTGRMRQRPGWTFPERWLPVADIARTRAFAPAPPWRLIAVALVVIALALAALLIVAGSQRKVAPPFGPARNGEIVYDSAGDLYVGNPDFRCQPVACRRPRTRQCAELLAGWHPGRVLPRRRLLSAGRRHCCGQGGWIGPGQGHVGAARGGHHLRKLDAGQPAPGRDQRPAGSGRLELLDVEGRRRRVSWRRTWTWAASRSARRTATRSRSVRSSTQGGVSSR